MGIRLDGEWAERRLRDVLRSVELVYQDWRTEVPRSVVIYNAGIGVRGLRALIRALEQNAPVRP